MESSLSKAGFDAGTEIANNAESLITANEPDQLLAKLTQSLAGTGIEVTLIEYLDEDCQWHDFGKAALAQLAPDSERLADVARHLLSKSS